MPTNYGPDVVIFYLFCCRCIACISSGGGTVSIAVDGGKHCNVNIQQTLQTLLDSKASQ